MVTLTRSAPAVAAPGTLIATDAENEAISLARQIMVEAYGDANSAQDLQSLLVPTLGSGEPGVSVDSILYMDTEDDSLYLRTQKDPAAYRQIAGSGGGGTVLQQVYLFYTRPTLTVPAVITAADNVTIASTGAGLEFTLLDDVEVPGPVLAGVDFVTEWFGGVTVEMGAGGGGELRARLKTTHRLGTGFTKRFTHVRETVRSVDASKEFNIDLSNFDTVSNIAVGTYRPPNTTGSLTPPVEVEITEEDVALPSRITYTLELILYASRTGARKVGNVTYLRFRNPITRSYQIDNRMAGASSLIQGAAPYAFYRQHAIAPIIPELPFGLTQAADSQLELTVIPRYVETQRIYADRDIVQDWDGAIEITANTNGVLEFTQRWYVEFASGANYTQDRTFRAQVSNGRPVLIDLDLFSVRQLFAPGTYPIGGQEVVITEDDLLDPRPATAALVVKLLNRDGSSKAGAITELNVQGGALTIYQLNVLTQPVEDAASLPFLRRTYLFYERPELFVTSAVGSSTPIPAGGLDFNILRDPNDPAMGREFVGPVYPGCDFVTQNVGTASVVFNLGVNPSYDSTAPIGPNNQLLRQSAFLVLTFFAKHEVNGKTFTPERTVELTVVNGQEYVLDLSWFNSFVVKEEGSFDQLVGGQSLSTPITEEDISSPVRITYTLRIRASDGNNFLSTTSLTKIQWASVQTRSYQIDHATGPPVVPPPVTINPSIASFDVEGDRHPAAGDVAGERYAYRLAVNQSAHASSLQLFGFHGSHLKTKPATATRLASADMEDFADWSGVIALPSGTNLSAGESYTLRAEVRAEGVTPVQEPTAYADYIITAGVIDAVHWGYVRYVSTETTATETAARVDFSNDTQSGQAVRPSYSIAVPTDGEYYQLYLAVRSDIDQPTGFTSVGLPATNSFYPAVDITRGTIAFKIYVLRPGQRLRSDANGETFGTVT